MFYLTKKFKFESAHSLKGHNSKCSNIHGHSYKMEVTLKKKQLNKEGYHKNMVMCTDHISVIVKCMIEKYLDHKFFFYFLKNKNLIYLD